MSEQVLSSELIELEVELERDDYKAYFFRRGGVLRKTIVVSRIIGIIFIIDFFVLPIYMQHIGAVGWGRLHFDMIMVLQILLFIALPIIGVPYGFYRSMNKTYKDNRGKAIRYTFSDSKIEVESKNGKAYYAWNELYNTKEPDKHFFIFTKKEIAFIIPKRYIEHNNAATTLLRKQMK